ncbi:MAG TPA: competence/damage-inducible protein A [Pseudonocardiaceae bacterium]
MATLRAGIIVTGTEMVSGQVTDRNGPWVSQRLGELGVTVTHLLCVGDRPQDLRGALEHLRDADLIVTSGGLGPTADDLTGQLVAEFAGVELELDEAMYRRIGEILAGFSHLSAFGGEALEAANRKQAMVPRGGTPVPPVGTAPGLVVPVAGGPTVLVLPGPPRELRAMWPAALETEAMRAVLARAMPPTIVRLRFYGLPESEIAATLRDLAGDIDLDALEVVTCLRRAELEVDLHHHGGEAAARAAEQLVAALTERHGRYLFSTDGSSLDDQVAALLQGRTIALAESCTGGLLAGRLTERPGASAYVMGGVVSYSNEAKSDLLDVPAALIEAHGAVSPEVARAMADGVRARFGTDVGVGVTGVAGPGGGTEAKPVGYVCVCVTTAAGELARDVVLPGDRGEVRDRSVVLAMHLIRRLLSRS